MENEFDLNKVKKIYFIGIGGIGMSALARYFNDMNIEVFGYDKVKTTLTEKLVSEGMKIHYDDDPSQIPEGVDLVVFTPAIPHHHKELNWFLDNEYTVKKRSEVLGMVSKEKKTIAIAGTHGKTSTSALTAHILKYAGLFPTAFLGGILINYESNYLFGTGDWIVAEADEYDRSFLRLSPNILVIMSMDADHLDIYGSHQNMVDAYLELSLQIEENGMLILRYDLINYFSKEWQDILASRGVEVVLFGDDGSNKYENVLVKNHKYHFDFKSENEVIANIVSTMPGKHNIENATAAISIAKRLGVESELIKSAMNSFKGIKRRFEIVHEDGFTLIDDYAHHPEELKPAISTILDLYDVNNTVVVFQPHLYSRTLDFYRGFATQLSRLECVLLMPIYPAREEAIEGVKSDMIKEIMTNKETYLVDKDSLVKKIKELKKKVVVTLGAADLDIYHESIINALK